MCIIMSSKTILWGQMMLTGTKDIWKKGPKDIKKKMYFLLFKFQWCCSENIRKEEIACELKF